MLSRILNYVRKNKVKVGVTSCIGLFLGYGTVYDALLIFHNPYRIEYKLNAIWNKFNPFYPTRVINKSMLCDKGNSIEYDNRSIEFLYKFCDVVPKLGITPQLIYTLLSNGANIKDCNDLTNRMFDIYKTQNFWEKCVNINPAFYSKIPSEFQTKEMNTLFAKSFKVGIHFRDESDQKRNHPQVVRIDNHINGPYNFEVKQKDDGYEYIFNGHFRVPINKDELNDFWMSLLRYDHKYRILFPHAPTEVQNSILEEVKSFKLHELRDFVMTGEQFNKLDVSKEKLVKNVNHDNIHHYLKLRSGLNTDSETFNPYCNCCKGGIYATTEKYQKFWKLSNGSKVYSVEVPNDSNVKVKIEDDNKFKATEIILKND